MSLLQKERKVTEVVEAKALIDANMDQRVITCDQKPSAHCAKEFKNPFVNFKIEVMNNLAKKRKLDVDSCETPARKSFMPMPLSPDLGCVMDYCSPPASGESVSSLALSQPASISLGTQESASSQLHCGHVKCQSKPVGAEDTELYSLRSESNLFSDEYTFDLDVDNTLSLSPISTCTAGGMSDHSKSFNSPNSSTSQDEPLPVRTVAEGQELDRGDKSVLEEFEKYVNLSVYGEEEDKCYFSSSYLKGCELVTPELLPTTSSSFLEIGKVETAEDERRPESCHTLAAPHGPSVSFAVEDLSPPSGLLLNAVNLPEEILESDVEEVWDIGPPIFESSVCHDEPSAADSEHNREVSGEEQGEVSEVLKPQSQTTLSDVETTLDTTLDTSYEKTILNVQVKSVVVVPHVSSGKPAAAPVPDQSRNKKESFRPLIFKTEADWEREKNAYVNSVARHLRENANAAPDVMDEMLTLANGMDDPTQHSPRRPWQHPSDLTHRNYQRRFGNLVPKMSLREWQTKSHVKHKRFAQVPKIFKRSPYP